MNRCIVLACQYRDAIHQLINYLICEFLMDVSRYKKGVKEIKDFAASHDISEDEVDRIFQECFQLLETQTSSKIQLLFKIFRFTVIILLFSITSLLFLYNHPSTHSIFLRNLQEYIYPGLRVFRKLAVPVISIYPSMTEWYDEWCILENPYFHVDEMDCQPCNSVTSVQDLTSEHNNSLILNNVGMPFIRRENTDKIDLDKLYETYQKHSDIFDRDAYKVASNSPQYLNIADVMQKRLDYNPSNDRDVHITWRLNRMEPNRKLRKLFPKLSGTPDWWSPSMEKFVFIDEPSSQGYPLPNPECAYVVVRCTNGERMIQLQPSPECLYNCKNLTILLTAQSTLWYNWWYWRPIANPSINGTEVSIMYLSSFC